MAVSVSACLCLPCLCVLVSVILSVCCACLRFYLRLFPAASLRLCLCAAHVFWPACQKASVACMHLSLSVSVSSGASQKAVAWPVSAPARSSTRHPAASISQRESLSAQVRTITQLTPTRQPHHKHNDPTMNTLSSPMFHMSHSPQTYEDALFDCLSVCLIVYLSVCLTVCSSVCLCVWLSVSQFVGLCACLCPSLSACSWLPLSHTHTHGHTLSVTLSVCLSLSLSSRTVLACPPIWACLGLKTKVWLAAELVFAAVVCGGCHRRHRGAPRLLSAAPRRGFGAPPIVRQKPLGLHALERQVLPLRQKNVDAGAQSSSQLRSSHCGQHPQARGFRV